MRVQLEGQSLRLRIDEAELTQLLGGNTVENQTALPDGHIARQRLRLAPRLEWRHEDGAWQIDLPDAKVRGLSERLPSREGLQFSLSTSQGAALQVVFDVDVRDSTRKRLSK